MEASPDDPDESSTELAHVPAERLEPGTEEVPGATPHDEPEPRPRRRRHHRVREALAVLAVGLVGAWLGMALLAHTTVQMGPFRVLIDTGFGRGETRLGLPPFGALTADTHMAPLSLSATLQDIDVERLTEMVNQRGIDGLVTTIQHDARERLGTFAWRVVGVAALGGLVVGLLVFRARWQLVAAGAGSSVLGVTLCLVFLFVTFRPSAFVEPTYSGTLALAPEFIGPVREATGRIEDLRAGLEQVVNGTVRAYTTLQTGPLDDEAIRVLHISDIHASPLGMDFARQVASGFDVDLVIDTGDLTSFATPVENLIVSQIPLFGRPYLFVRGNHDSLSLQAAVGRERNALVLDGQVRTVAGLTVYGLGHPAFTPARGVPVDDEAFETLARDAGAIVAEDLERSGAPIDVIAVHDDRMAEAVAGRVPLVISGHFDETRARVINGTLFLRIGTTGGSGAGVFRGLDIPFTAQVLYFSRDDATTLIAYDVIEQDPEEGTLRVQRFSISEEFGELQLTPTPSPTPTPTATGTPSGETGTPTGVTTEIGSTGPTGPTG